MRTYGSPFLFLVLASPVLAAPLTNGGFETGLTGWTVTGSTITTPPAMPFPAPPPPPPATGGAAGDATTLMMRAGTPPGPLTTILPTEGANFAFLTNGPGAARTATRLSQTFDLPAGGAGLTGTLLFDYRFMTNDINTSSQFNDAFQATLAPAAGAPFSLVLVSRNDLQPDGSGPLTALAMAGVGGFRAGTGWLTASVDVTALLGQAVTLSFVVWDVGDNAGDSAAALDNVRVTLVAGGAVPEPPALALFGAGALGLLAYYARYSVRA
jgi:hypothetical protein